MLLADLSLARGVSLRADRDRPAAPTRRDRCAANVAEGGNGDGVEAADDVAQSRADLGRMRARRGVAGEDPGGFLFADPVSVCRWHRSLGCWVARLLGAWQLSNL